MKSAAQDRCRHIWEHRPISAELTCVRCGAKKPVGSVDSAAAKGWVCPVDGSTAPHLGDDHAVACPKCGRKMVRRGPEPGSRIDYGDIGRENAERMRKRDGETDTVAALYVEKDGAYFGLPGVDPWDEERDARLYAGPWPVVAHPPCNKWSPLAYINRRRIPGYEIGDDGGCFEAALNAVRTYGGVLEHPYGSLAWKHFGLDKPERGIWKGYFGSYVTEVDQAAYGHRARKRTWLYVVASRVPPPLDWEPRYGGAIVSGFTHQPKGEHVACEHRRVRPKEASRTPPAFRDVLLDMARSAGMEVAA